MVDIPWDIDVGNWLPGIAILLPIIVELCGGGPVAPTNVFICERTGLVRLWVECCAIALFVTPILLIRFVFTDPGCERAMKFVEATLQVNGELEVDKGIDD